MTRSTAEITADLEKIRTTIEGLRSGFNMARPLTEAKLGQPLASQVYRTVWNVLDVHEGMALVLGELAVRLDEIERQQDKIVDGIGETVRTLA